MRGHSEDKNPVRSFGFLMGWVLAIIAGILLYNEKETLSIIFGGIAGAFFFSTLVCPSLLSGIFVRWMKFAEVIGRFNTKLILSLMYTLIFTFLRVLLFVFRKDPLERKFDSSLDSYWSDHEPMDSDPKRYEKQF